jgi:hypothetical protein
MGAMGDVARNLYPRKRNYHEQLAKELMVKDKIMTLLLDLERIDAEHQVKRQSIMDRINLILGASHADNSR